MDIVWLGVTLQRSRAAVECPAQGKGYDRDQFGCGSSPEEMQVGGD
jgi:hypothetical protein